MDPDMDTYTDTERDTPSEVHMDMDTGTDMDTDNLNRHCTENKSVKSAKILILQNKPSSKRWLGKIDSLALRPFLNQNEELIFRRRNKCWTVDKRQTFERTSEDGDSSGLMQQHGFTFRH